MWDEAKVKLDEEQKKLTEKEAIKKNKDEELEIEINKVTTEENMKKDLEGEV